MSLSLVYEVLKILKPSLDAGSVKEEAADDLVNYLIDEGHSPSEIKHTFRGDKEIKDALEFYMESPEDGLYHQQNDDTFDDYPDEEEDEW